MRITIELTEQERKDALVQYVKDATGVPDIFTLENILGYAGAVTFATMDHYSQGDSNEQQKDS